jgi:hypothetical protein
LHTTIFPESLDGTSHLGWKDFTLNLSRLHENGLNVIFHSLVLQGKLK